MSDSAPAESARSPWARPVRELLGRMALEEKAAQISAVVLTADDTPPVPGIGVVYVPTSTPDAAARLTTFRQATAGDRLGIPVLPLAIGPDLDRPFLPPLGRAATWDVRLAERMAGSTARAQRGAGLYGHLVPAGSTADRKDGTSGTPAVSDPVLAADLAAARIRGAQGRTAGRTNPIGPDTSPSSPRSGCGPTASGTSARCAPGSWPPRRPRCATGRPRWSPRPPATRACPARPTTGCSATSCGASGGSAERSSPIPVPSTRWTLVTASPAGPTRPSPWKPGSTSSAPARRPTGSSRSCAAAPSPPGWSTTPWPRCLGLKLRLGMLGTPSPASPSDESAVWVARTALTRSIVLLTDPSGVLPLTRARTVDVVPGVIDSSDVAALASALATALPGRLVRSGTGPVAPDTVVVVAARPEDAVRAAEHAVAVGRRCVAVVTGDRVQSLDALTATTATVLVCWRPLGEHADVLAEVLTGRAEPGGRLPVALPAGDGGMFPLGHGSGYTTFDYSRLVISPAVLDGGDVLRVRCWVTNTGRRPGRDIVQVYLDNPTGRTVVTGGTALAAFTTVEAAPGQSVPVTIRLPLTRLAVWNRTMRHILEPGTVDVLVGRSAADIRLRGTVTVAAHPSHWRG